jgi:osmotically-inducible protein OsmY
MSRRINDGDKTGYKQDRYRNSRFEVDDRYNQNYGGVTQKTANTIGGAYAENRGRREAEDMDARSRRFDNSPFENGRLYNWNRRQGWDEYYGQESSRQGGAQMDHHIGHRGKGPKGYKRADDSIFHDVCDTLSLSPDVDATNIEVSVKEGVVYLNGSVRDRNSKRMAELEIENISGVQDVQNLLSFKKGEAELH